MPNAKHNMTLDEAKSAIKSVEVPRSGGYGPQKGSKIEKGEMTATTGKGRANAFRVPKKGFHFEK